MSREEVFVLGARRSDDQWPYLSESFGYQGAPKATDADISERLDSMDFERFMLRRGVWKLGLWDRGVLSLGPSPSSELQLSKLPIQTADGLEKMEAPKPACEVLSLVAREGKTHGSSPVSLRGFVLSLEKGSTLMGMHSWRAKPGNCRKCD